MELRHLRYFVTVAQTMNFRQAAAQLNMTQPPLSLQIQQLESELGFELFYREGRTISLTVAGEVFLKEAQGILKMVDKAVIHASQAARGEIGQLHIGFVESAAYSLLPPILNAFRESFPSINVTLTGMPTNQQITALKAGRIDLGFCRLWPKDIESAFQSETILQEPLCAVLPKDHHLAQQQRLSLSQLADEDFVLFPRNLGNSLFDLILRACHEAGFIPQIKQEAIQMTTNVGLVAAGMGVSVLPAAVMQLPHAGVKYFLLSTQEKSPISIVWKQGDPAAVLQNFIEFALRHK